MALKKSSAGTNPPARKRTRRTEADLIAALEEKIEALRRRAAVLEVKRSPTLKATIAALKWIDKAVGAAQEQGDTGLQHVLADARKPIAEHLEAQGIDVARTRRPRGRRARSSQPPDAEG